MAKRLIPRSRAAALTAPLLVVAMGIGGCTRPLDGYPSLAPRPIETLSLNEPEHAPPPPETADPAAVARYAPFVERARAADASFRKVLAEERASLVRGRGAATGSDAWTAAQVSLSRVETARGTTGKALADLDAARDGDPTRTNTGAALASQQAFEQVQTIADEEQAAVAAAWPGQR
ncbi:hypothetical protein [Sphingomonas abietis]|uniref:DUF4398 domain-containing protein n=1 Tax=Sphingomonas abietis TaxID=3012344 RepID=A0ABY7NR22_9SPHN|nr:hypothetical protein [Sphingomonas abietis]WBO24004.1 hypothetical protein PBT88_07805 [Sphingomonas abietis]